MRYQWKLLLLMLVVSILPLILIRGTGVNIVKRMGDNFAARADKLLTENAERQLKTLVDDYTAIIWRDRELFEMALMYQAAAAEQCLSEALSTPSAFYFTEDFETGKGVPPPDTAPSLIHFRMDPNSSGEALPISYGHQSFKPAPGQSKAAALKEAALLGGMTPNYQRIHRLMRHRRIFWQHICLTSGLFSTYPAGGMIPAELDPRTQSWYQKGLRENQETWTAPYVDPATQQVVMAVSAPIRSATGEILGVTALVVSAKALFESDRLLKNIPPGTRAFMTYLTARPDNGQKGLAILSNNDPDNPENGAGRTPSVKTDWLISDDPDQWQALAGDFSAGISHFRRMRFDGRDCLWAYGPLSSQAYLVLITPYEEILKPARLSDNYVKAQIDRVVTITGIVILGLGGIVIILSLTFARTVTRPIRILVKGAQALAEGDFNARVEIRSNDEFGRMGLVFNQVGPQLQEHYRMRHALSLAMEVQQNLLPKVLPVMDGLDIAGAGVYCDETGGDYYDFLTKDGDPSATIGVVVGDVSGHGIPSALLMATTRAFLRQRYAMAGELSQVISDVNRLFSKDVADCGRFLTLFFCEIDLLARSVQWVNAGHDPAILYHAPTGGFEELTGKGLPLGVNENSIYKESRHPLENGHILAIGTDGIRETRNPEGEMFGKERFKAIIRTHAHLPAQAILQTVMTALVEFRETRPAEDDITLIVIKVNDGKRPKAEV